jgi:hypothetical protein
MISLIFIVFVQYLQVTKSDGKGKIKEKKRNCKNRTEPDYFPSFFEKVCKRKPHERRKKNDEIE